jgi:hypothetical protein
MTGPDHPLGTESMHVDPVAHVAASMNTTSGTAIESWTAASRTPVSPPESSPDPLPESRAASRP